LTKSRILRSVFYGEEFEIEVLDHCTMIIFLWNVKKNDIWQAAALLESTDIKLGYGFGNVKAEAKTNAEAILEKWRGSG
jgi:hypothetical protein